MPERGPVPLARCDNDVVEHKPRKQPQALGVTAAVVALIVIATHAASGRSRSPVATPPFQVWLLELMAEARAKGFDGDLVTRALGGVQPLPQVIAADRAQAAPDRGLAAYLNQRLTDDLVAEGQAKMRQHRALLERVERTFGVQGRFVVAIWGAETSYGPYTGDVPVFQSLATLAWEPRRADYFRAELFDALRIVQRGHIELARMRGSWAGAMGQPQFMPSSYLKYAYDFDRDGRRDIWRSVPDVLASIANYLRSFGWRNAETWGREVRLSNEVRQRLERTAPVRTAGCGAVRTLTIRRGLPQWAADGVRLADGDPLPRSRVPASLVVTSDGRSFLVYRNYESILAYNCSHRYALSVAMLADALRSSPPSNL